MDDYALKIEPILRTEFDFEELNEDLPLMDFDAYLSVSNNENITAWTKHTFDAKELFPNPIQVSHFGLNLDDKLSWDNHDFESAIYNRNVSFYFTANL
jgi:hypothetical protein